MSGEIKGEAGGGAAGVSESELRELQRAEEAKGDPALDEVEAARIDLPESEKDEPFDRLAAAARRLSPERARAAVESLLFLAEKPVPVEELRAATGLEAVRVRKALDELSGHYREGVSGVVLHEVAGGWQLRTAPEAAPFARRFLRVKPQRLTRAALETLAIVAYRQPVTRPEIEDIRGVDSGAVVKALLERRLVKILGKKEEPGRPILYGTSKEFLEFFALKDLASLPTLREFHELSEEHREIVEKEAPPEDRALEGIVAELSDPSARSALEVGRAEGDAALDDLERAMSDADEKGRAAAAALDATRPKDEPEPQEGGAAGPARTLRSREALMAEQRLQKFLAAAGVTSRRKAEALIAAGRVEVNGIAVRAPGTRVDPARDLVVVDGKPVGRPEGQRYFLLYKPAGCVTTLSDPEGRPTAASYLSGVKARVFPVGRLDYDAEGAVLFTTDGELANRLAHPRYGHRRTYLVKVKGEPRPEQLERMAAGVRLDDGPARALECALHEKAERNTWIRIVVGEGRFHLVKRLCEAVGLQVARLFRPEFGGVSVEGLRAGEYRALEREEVQALKRAAGLLGEKVGMAPPARPLPRAARRHGHGPPAPRGGAS